MKPLNKTLTGILAAIFLLPALSGYSQGAAKGDLSITISYTLTNNTVPSLTVKAKTKVDGRFQNVAGVAVDLFLDKDSVGTHIGQVVTNKKGEVSTLIPTTVQKEWVSNAKHTFLAVFKGNKKFEASKADLTISRAKILIDAGDDKTVTASVLELKDHVWTPVKGVELVLGVKRLDADLTINETPTFTTDSTGKVSGDFKRDHIPGDSKGNITLVARVDDNDTYGSLRIEKNVTWGAKFTPVSTFDQRSLFATRDKTPIWLLCIAYSIVFTVWGILFSLVRSIIKIKKLGETA